MPARSASALIEDLKEGFTPVFVTNFVTVTYCDSPIEYQKVPTKSVNTAEEGEGDSA